MKNSSVINLNLAGLLLVLTFSCEEDTPTVIPSLSTVSVTTLTASSATSGGSITRDGGAPITAKGVCWSTSPNPTLAGNKTTDGSGLGSFASSITGLEPGTTYYVRAYATNRVGTAYGNQITITSLSNIATLSTVGLLAVTATSAIGGGNITSDGAASITARGVCWSTRPNPTIAGSKTTNGTGTGSFTSFLTELTPVTTYYVRAYATNSVGTAYGNQVSVTTSYYGDGDYILLQEATIGNGVDLVFMGDGYTAAEIVSGKYEEIIQESVDIFFEVEPYKSYSEYFNVYMIYAVSEESGIGDIEQTVTNKFGTRFSVYQREMQTNLKQCFQYAAYAPIATLSGTTIVLVANTSVYGGTTLLYPEMPSVAICAHHSEFRYILQHEGGGHGFGKLADEYVESYDQIPEWGIDELRGFQIAYGIFLNVDLTDNLSKIRWKHFIGLPNYSYVGAYEGGYYYEKGVWRPEDHSTMRDIMTDYFNAPSREIIVKRIMLLAGLDYSFESFKSRDIAQPGIQLRTAAILKSQLQPLPKPVIVDPKRGQRGGLP